MLSETELQLYWTNAQVLHDRRYPDAIRNTAASALKNIAEGVPRLNAKGRRALCDATHG